VALDALPYYCVTGAVRATLAARAIAGETDFYDLMPPWNPLVTPLVLILATAQAWLDCRLAQNPRRFPFTCVSGRSYLLEIPHDFGTITIRLWLLPNVYARARRRSSEHRRSSDL
jgi:hypothetical protein